MAKLDNQNRLTIPKSLMEISDTDFSGKLHLFFNNTSLYLDNPVKGDTTRQCLGEIRLEKANRFFLPKLAREIFDINPNDNIVFFVQNGKVTLKKFLSITASSD